jgi:rifampicin phosphotransferase
MVSVLKKERSRYLRDGALANDRSAVGGEACKLARLEAAGFPVPPWFVVTAEAFLSSVPAELAAPQQGSLFGDFTGALRAVKAADDVIAELEATLAKFPEGTQFAVRSSAVAGDSQSCSYAGQFDSFLCIRKAEVADRLADVWRSAFNDRVMAYRKLHLDARPISAPAVIVQVMMPPAGKP